MLTNYIEYDGPLVAFGGDSKGKTRGYGNLIVGKTTITNVTYVESLNHNLFSVSQFCSTGKSVEFSANKCAIKNKEGEEILLTDILQDNLYIVQWSDEKETCLVTKSVPEVSWLWHKRLCHLNFKAINKLARKKLAEDLPDQVYYKDHVCEACQAGKQTRSSFPSIAAHNTSRILELLHLDLFGPVTPRSINGKKYTLVIVDDYSRYTWVIFLHKKKETLVELPALLTKLSNMKNASVISIRSDRGT